MFDLTLRPQSMPHRLRVKISSGLAIVFSTYIVTTALIILHLRSWDSVVLKQIAVFSSYSLILFGVVSIASCLARQQGTYLWVLPAATLLFMGLPFVMNQLGSWMIFPLVLLGGLLFVLSIALAYNVRKSRFELIWLPCSGIVLALFYFGEVNGYGLAHIFADVAAYTNSSNVDNLFHASIINMLANFSTPSTGLDGVEPIAYHVFFHRWLAASQSLAPGNTPLLIAIGLQLSLIPVLFFTWAVSIGWLLNGEINLLSLLIWAFGSLILLPFFVRDDYLTSESFTFSLPVFFAMAPVAYHWIVNHGSNNRDRFWTLVLAVVAIIACSLAKVSTGAILGIFLIGCLILPRLLKTDRRSLLLYGGYGLLLCIFCLGLGYFIVGAPPLNWYPFHSAIAYPQQVLGMSQIAILCLWAFYDWDSHNSSNLLSRQYLTLTLAITYAASLVPGLLIEIALSTSILYFQQSAMLLLLLFGLVGSINSCNTLGVKAYVSRLWTPSSKSKVVALTIAWLVVVTQLNVQIGLFIANELQTGPAIEGGTTYPISKFLALVIQYTRYLNLFDQNRPVPTDMATAFEGLKTRDMLNDLLWPHPIDLTHLRKLSALYRIKKAVDSAGIDPTAANTMVYISPDFDEFWSQESETEGLTSNSRICWVKPFHIPAVLGLPLLNGVRDEVNNCDNTPYYGMPDYDSDSWNIVLSDKAACDRAKNLGFSRVFMIHQDHQRLLSCPNQ